MRSLAQIRHTAFSISDKVGDVVNRSDNGPLEAR